MYGLLLLVMVPEPAQLCLNVEGNKDAVVMYHGVQIESGKVYNLPLMTEISADMEVEVRFGHKDRIIKKTLTLRVYKGKLIRYTVQVPRSYPDTRICCK